MTPDPTTALSAYPPAVARCRWQVIGGGFSGAHVWRGSTPDGPAFALKRWPDGFTDSRLRQIHQWMHAARTLPFVPTVVPTRHGDTLMSAASADGRVWDVTAWMPGEPIRAIPTVEQLEAAVAALADLHRVWSRLHSEQAPCPAVRRRLALLDEWERTGPTAFDHLPADLAGLLRTGWAAVRVRLQSGRAALLTWQSTPVPVHPCLCDVHADHVLFTGDRLSGVIDFGAMKLDSPAVDVARFLGDLTAANTPLFNIGLEAYRGEPSFPVPLVRVLADTGPVCGLANWHLRLLNRSPTDADRVSQRIRKLLTWLDSSRSFHPQTA